MAKSFSPSRYERLQRLHRLLVQDREAAKSLDIQGLEAAVQDMQELVSALETETQPLSPEERRLAADIRHEVERSMYFFRRALAWVEESVQAVRGEKDPPGYSSCGDVVGTCPEGRLLSGRV